MEREELKYLEEVEPDFNISKFNKKFITLRELKGKTQEVKEKLYPAIASYNQRRVLAKFMELLNDKFGDKLLIDGSDMLGIKYTARHSDGIYEDLTFTTFGHSYVFSCFLTFAIDGYIYYIQFCENPLLPDSSYISTKKVYKSLGKYYTPEYYGTSDDTNINDLFIDLYSTDFDVDVNAEILLNYFMVNRYQKEGMLYLGQDRRTFYIEEE